MLIRPFMFAIMMDLVDRIYYIKKNMEVVVASTNFQNISQCIDSGFGLSESSMHND